MPKASNVFFTYVYILLLAILFILSSGNNYIASANIESNVFILEDNTFAPLFTPKVNALFY
jgi:hypothetical protein